MISFLASTDNDEILVKNDVDSCTRREKMMQIATFVVKNDSDRCIRREKRRRYLDAP